ncbi:MAG TPA: NAD(P)H-dependent oxidoreductase [Abditibacteriaceae bacterium]|jgi:nitroreductase
MTLNSTNQLDVSVSESEVLEALNWRYAVQQFDTSRTIPEDTWKTLEEALRLAPSSLGLQPWKFIVVTDPQIKQQLVEHSYGQTKVAENSHLLVIASKTDYTGGDTEEFIALNARVRGVETTSLAGLAGMINGTVSGLSAEALAVYLQQQAFIPLGMFLAAAAMLRVDAAPMGGFVPAEYNRILGLDGTGYTATVIAAAGYRSDDDKYGHLPKVRYAREDVFLDI